MLFRSPERFEPISDSEYEDFVQGWVEYDIPQLTNLAQLKINRAPVSEKTLLEIFLRAPNLVSFHANVTSFSANGLLALAGAKMDILCKDLREFNCGLHAQMTPVALGIFLYARMHPKGRLERAFLFDVNSDLMEEAEGYEGCTIHYRDDW